LHTLALVIFSVAECEINNRNAQKRYMRMVMGFRFYWVKLDLKHTLLMLLAAEIY